MLMGEGFNLNSVRRYNDSFVEILRQTILEHEAIFRMQVYELHRLYKIQKILMEDLNLKEFKGRTSWTASRPSIPMPLQDQSKYKQLTGEKFLPALSMVRPQTANQGFFPKLKPRPLDLQLPADDYISHFGPDLPNQSKQGDSWESLKESMKVGTFSVSNQVADPEEMKLSLSAGKDATYQQRSSRCASLSIPDVIDLEGPVVGSISLGVAKPSSSNYSEAPSAYSGDRSGVQASVPRDLSIPGNVKEDPGHWIFGKCSLKDNRRPEQTFCGSGINDHYGSSPPSVQCNKKPSSSWNMDMVDLNIVQLEESSCFSNAPLVTFPSPATSSSGVHGLADESLKGTNAVSTSSRKANSSFSDGTSDLLQPDNAAFSTLTDAGEKDNSTQASSRSGKSKGNSGSKPILIDLESLPEDQREFSEDLGDQSSEPRENNLDFSLERQSDHLHPHDKMDGLARTANDEEIGRESCEKSEEDTVSSSSPCPSHVIQGECFLDSPATNKPYRVDSGKREEMLFGKDCKHKLAGSYYPVMEESGANQIHSQVTEARSSQHDPIVIAADCPCGMKDKSSNCAKLKHQDSDELQQEAQETDQLVCQAAESLLHISLGGLNHPQNCIPNIGSGNLTNGKNEEPQYSSESFESVMLRLDATSMDDYCVTSAPFEVKETETEIKGCGVSLRRGRRLKDFQKDVLPGLVSLSRLEICEDIHSIGGTIKSNEFRKSRSKKASAQNWFEPMRSRRSRFNYVC